MAGSARIREVQEEEWLKELTPARAFPAKRVVVPPQIGGYAILLTSAECGRHILRVDGYRWPLLLAGNLTNLGLIDEYRLYFRPFVLGGGKPYFAVTRPPLRLVSTDPVGEDRLG
jgi:hypothetical protein